VNIHYSGKGSKEMLVYEILDFCFFLGLCVCARTHVYACAGVDGWLGRLINLFLSSIRPNDLLLSHIFLPYLH
jgi:hypothetical protein